MLHALDRGVIHFFSSAGILLCGMFVIRWIQRRWNLAWLPSLIQPQMILVAVCIFSVAGLREAVDVNAGQSLGKAISDWLSWALGCGCATWGLWRFRSI